MNKTHALTLATIAVALAGAATLTSAVASEATQFVDPPGTLTRTEVKADLARARQASNVVQLGEATVFVDAPASHRALAQRPPAGARPVTRAIQVGEATVFVDEPGTRSREEVRAEARAAARNPRAGSTHYTGS